MSGEVGPSEPKITFLCGEWYCKNCLGLDSGLEYECVSGKYETITEAKSYDVLVGAMVLYPMDYASDFLMETTFIGQDGKHEMGGRLNC